MQTNALKKSDRIFHMCATYSNESSNKIPQEKREKLLLTSSRMKYIHYSRNVPKEDASPLNR